MEKKRRQLLYRSDLKLYDVICTIVNDCIMKEARYYGVNEERAKRISMSALRRIVEKISHTWGPCLSHVPSCRTLRKWKVYKDGLTKTKKVVAKKYSMSLSRVEHIMGECAKERKLYAGLPWDFLPWYMRLTIE